MLELLSIFRVLLSVTGVEITMDIQGEKVITKGPTQVLAIGDQQQQEAEQETPVEKYTMLTFLDDCGKHFSLLLTGLPTRTPDAGQRPIEWFGMKPIRRENQPTRYQFFCVAARMNQSENVNPFYFFKTMNACLLMRDVRKILRGERWISKYEVMGPLKGQLEGYGYTPEENYVRDAIYKALRAETRRDTEKLLPFVLNLHREYVLQRKRHKQSLGLP